MKKQLLGAALSLFILAGCGSTSMTNYYSLPEAGVPKQITTERSIVLSVKLVSFLETSSMVYQQDDVTLNFSGQNLWAQPPAEAIAQSLVNKLNRSSHRMSYNLNSNTLAQRNLVVTINQFYGRFDGKVAVGGFYQLFNAQKQVIKTEPFYYLIPQKGDGYAPMVKALDKGLDQITQDITNNL